MSAQAVITFEITGLVTVLASFHAQFSHSVKQKRPHTCKEFDSAIFSFLCVGREQLLRVYVRYFQLVSNNCFVQVCVIVSDAKSML